MGRSRDLADGTLAELNVDSNTLAVDATNNFVGVRTNTPSVVFDVNGPANFNGRIRNNNGGSAASPSIQPGFDGDTGIFHAAANTIGFSTLGTERLRILSSGGITFNGDTAAANALDDYEEGTWTPSVSSSGGSITTVGAVSGRYVKIGQFVLVTCTVAISNNGTGSGAVLVANLPYSSEGAQYVGCGRENNATGKLLQVYLPASSATFYVKNYDDSYPVSSGYQFFATVSYRTT